MKINRNEKQLLRKNEVVRLEMRQLFLKLALEWSMDDYTKDSKKILYIPVSIIHDWNFRAAESWQGPQSNSASLVTVEETFAFLPQRFLCWPQLYLQRRFTQRAWACYHTNLKSLVVQIMKGDQFGFTLMQFGVQAQVNDFGKIKLDGLFDGSS